MEMESVILANQHWNDINPIQFGRQNCAPGHAFGPATREYVLLHYVVSGRGKLTKKGKIHDLHPGQIFVIEPYEITYYQADQKQPWRYIWIGFECGTGLPQGLEQPVLTIAGAAAVFTSMWAAAMMKTGREAFLCGKIWELLALLQQRTAGENVEGSRHQEYVNAAKTYMETEYMRGVSVTELAKQLNLDRSYFSGLFKKATGKSPVQYLTQLRLNKGAQLMREYGQTPGEAARSTGYADVFSFSRMFRRYYGVSPTQYLRGCGAKNNSADC